MTDHVALPESGAATPNAAAPAAMAIGPIPWVTPRELRGTRWLLAAATIMLGVAAGGLAISAGAMRTLSLAGIKGGKSLMGTGRQWSLLKEDTSMEGVAGCALYLLSPLGRSIAGEVIHVDAGFHVVGVPDAGEEE